MDRSWDRRWLLVAALAVVSVGSGLWFGRRAGISPATGMPPTAAASPVPTTDDAPAIADSGTMVIHVSGWVVRPGLVNLPAGSRLGEAVASAGGARPGARLDGVNLAQALVDGQQVVIPGPDGSGSKDVAESPPATDGTIRLNSATASDLERLPGVGPVLAERIVAHRQAHGPFSTLEDLLDVPGIGEAKLESIRQAPVTP